MPDIDVMRELTGQLRGPGFDELVAVSRRRRRRAAASAAAAVAAVVLAVGAVAVALPDGTDAPQPAPQPSPTSATPTGVGDPELARVRARGEVQGQVFTPDGSLMATKYVVCHGCIGEGPADLQVAIEVTEGEASALFEGRGPHVRLILLDEHTVLVQDSAGPKAPVRHRLLRADGTEVDLHRVDDPAPAVPGPGVFIDDYDSWSAGMSGPQSLAVVDEEARTVQPVAAPAVAYWGPDTDQELWGVTDDCRVLRAEGGTWAEYRPGCANEVGSFLVADWFPAGWLQPGRMVVAEYGNGGRNLLHVTLDGGETWQQYPVSDPRFVTATLRDIG